MARENKKGFSHWLLDRLAETGTRHVFVVPGANIGPFLEALVRHAKVQPVVCTHEQGAGYMADGYARFSGGVGACAAVGGPGASNLLTAAVTARLDHSNVLFLTGDVPRAQRDQGAFQDAGCRGTRDSALFRAAVSASLEADDLPGFSSKLAQALDVLKRPGSGPIHLRVPRDMQTAAIPRVGRRPGPGSARATALAGDAIQRLERLIRSGPRLLLLVGEEVLPPGVAQKVRQAAEEFWLPVATTLETKGILPEDHPLALGNFGYGGTRRATEALLEHRRDALLILGAELTERNSGGWHPRLLGTGEPAVRCTTRPCPPRLRGTNPKRMHADPGVVLDWLLRKSNPLRKRLIAEKASRRQWVDELRRIPLEYAAPRGWDAERPLYAGRLVAEMRACLPGNAVLFVDSGLHRIFAGHYWRSGAPRRFLTAGVTGAMGWAIAAAIGASFSRAPGLPVVLTGDGCMRMHGLELATAVRYRRRVIVCVSNNASYGNYQRRLLPECGAARLGPLPDTDWAAFARLLGAQGRRVATIRALRNALHEALKAQGPFLIDARTSLSCEFPQSTRGVCW